jgi:hypothetical protein
MKLLLLLSTALPGDTVTVTGTINATGYTITVPAKDWLRVSVGCTLVLGNDDSRQSRTATRRREKAEGQAPRLTMIINLNSKPNN